MNKKRINEKLTRVFESFSKSIKSEKVRKAIARNTIITGGAITSMLLNEEVSDFDIYFRNKETALIVANYFADEFNLFLKAHKKDAKRYCPFINILDGEIIRTDFINGMIIENGQLHMNQKTIARLIEDDNLFRESFPSYTDPLPLLYQITPPDRIRIFISSEGTASINNIFKNFEQLQELPEEMIQADITTNAKATDVTENLDVGNAIEYIKKMINGKDIKEHFPVFFSANAITLRGKIQLIFRFYGEPEEIHKNFDFVHCTNYWDSATKKVVFKSEALLSILTKTLYYHGSLYPICSLFRIRKFVSRGFFISAGEILKIAYQVSDLDLNNLAVLEEQLIGVDTAYFQHFIYEIKKWKETGENINETHIVSLLDKIFE